MHKLMNKTPTKPTNNQMKPKQTHKKKKKNQMKPTSQSLYGFRFSRNREIERTTKKRKVKSDEPVLPWEIEKEEELVAPRKREEEKREKREECVAMDLKFHGLWEDLKSTDLDPWNPWWIWPSQIQIQINGIQKKLLLLAVVLLEKWDSLIKLTAYWYSPRLHKK